MPSVSTFDMVACVDEQKYVGETLVHVQSHKAYVQASSESKHACLHQACPDLAYLTKATNSQDPVRSIMSLTDCDFSRVKIPGLRCDAICRRPLPNRN